MIRVTSDFVFLFSPENPRFEFCSSLVQIKPLSLYSYSIYSFLVLISPPPLRCAHFPLMLVLQWISSIHHDMHGTCDRYRLKLHVKSMPCAYITVQINRQSQQSKAERPKTFDQSWMYFLKNEWRNICLSLLITVLQSPLSLWADIVPTEQGHNISHNAVQTSWVFFLGK